MHLPCLPSPHELEAEEQERREQHDTEDDQAVAGVAVHSRDGDKSGRRRVHGGIVPEKPARVVRPEDEIRVILRGELRK